MSNHCRNITLAKNPNGLLARHFIVDFGSRSERFTNKIKERNFPNENSTEEVLTRKRKNRETF